MPLRLAPLAREGGRRLTPTEDGLQLAAQQLFAEWNLRMAVQQGRQWLQDVWFLTYNMIDGQQGDKNRSPYHTTRPIAIVDTARRVLSRNPMRYRVIGQQLQRDREEREPLRILENILYGLMYDIDRQLRRRGEMISRQHSAFSSLVRGQWAYKLHLSTAKKTSTGSPNHYTQYDPRLVLGNVDSLGVESAVYYNTTNMAALYADFPQLTEPLVRRVLAARTIEQARQENAWLYQPLLILEYSTREEHGVCVDLSGLPAPVLEALRIDPNSTSDANRWVWIDPPAEHGFGVSLIQFGNVNPVPAGVASREAAAVFAEHTVLNRLPVHRGAGDVAREEMVSPSLILPPGIRGTNQHLGGGMVDVQGSMAGRSILAPVVHLFPIFNDMAALMRKAVQKEVEGTWTFSSRGIGLPNLRLGDGSINPIGLQERLEQVGANAGVPDTIALMQLVSQDISDATIDLRFLLPADFQGSGFARQRMEQGAMTALSDYQQGLEDWAISLAETWLAQYRASFKRLGNWQVVGRQPGNATKFFVVDIDDSVSQILTEFPEPPVIEAKTKVALPIDMAARINMAKTAIDPNNPVMSLAEALDLIMEFDDSESAYDSIIADIGMRNPTIVLMQVAESFRRKGAPELADIIMQDFFRQRFSEDAQARRLTTANSQIASGTPSSAAPPEVTGAATAGTIAGG